MKIKMYLTSIVLIVIALLIIMFVSVEVDTLTGYFSLVEIAPEGFIFQEPSEISQEAAQLALWRAEDQIKSMQESNLVTSFVEDALQEAQESYNDEDYLNVFKLAQLISFIEKEKTLFLLKIKKRL